MVILYSRDYVAMRVSRWILVCFCLSVAYPSNAGLCAEELPGGSASSIARFCIDGFLTGRERLRSGQVHVVEEAHSTVSDSALHKYFVAFDLESRGLRFDDSVGDRKVRTIRLPDKEIIYTVPNKVVNVFASGGLPDVEGAKPIDLRAIGLVTLSEFKNRVSYDELQKFLLSADVKRAVDEPEGKIRVTWSYALKPAGAAERTIWFDKRHEYSPVRMEVSIGAPNPGGDSMTLLEWTTTDWDWNGDFWVPSRCEMHRQQPKESMSVALTWETINEPVENAALRVEDIIPADTLVADHRLGTPNPIPLSKFQGLDNSIDLSASSGRTLQIVFLVVNVVILTGLFGLWVYRKRVMR